MRMINFKKLSKGLQLTYIASAEKILAGDYTEEEIYKISNKLRLLKILDNDSEILEFSKLICNK